VVLFVDKWERRREVARKRSELREQALSYKGGKCEICGYCRSSRALDFHHVNPREKDFTLSSRMTSWVKIKKELDKCILLCANCHREVHDGYHPGFLVLDDDDRNRWDDGDGYFDSLSSEEKDNTSLP